MATGVSAKDKEAGAAPGGFGGFITGAVDTAAAALAPAVQKATTPKPKPQPTATTSGAAAVGGGIDVTGVQAWADALYEFYLGRPATQADLEVIASQGWTQDQLKQHLRAQPSYIPGLSIGGYEDLLSVSRNEYLKYLGHEPGDQDIRELVSKGLSDQFSINSYLKNRPDVVALHPGAPIDLTDEEYGAYKQPVSAHYQQNLQRDASDEEVRQAFRTRNTPAPATGVELEPTLQIDSQSKALKAPSLLSPTARGFA